MKIIDAHTHIDYITCDVQPDVVGAICCAVAESDWNKIIDLTKHDNRIYGAVGVHPWVVDSVKDDFYIRLIKLLETNSNYMVGEIGLDKYKPNMQKQIEVFTTQFDIATKLNRIVFLHCVGAWDKILCVLKQYKNSRMPKIVVHNFNANKDILEKLLEYKNIYFSLGKNAVYGKNCRIEQIPVNRILVETDGKKEVLLKDILLKIMQIKNDKNIADVIYDNTLKVLKNE